MKNLDLLPISIKRILELCDVKYHMDEDIVITQLENTPLPSDNRHMRCTLVVLCLSGEASYSIGTIEHRVKANDVIIVGEGQVLGVVEDILPGAAAQIYSVKTPGGAEVLVPAVPAFITEVVPGEYVRMSPIDGMFENSDKDGGDSHAL